jgi:hypothetical protein
VLRIFEKTSRFFFQLSTLSYIIKTNKKPKASIWIDHHSIIQTILTKQSKLTAQLRRSSGNFIEIIILEYRYLWTEVILVHQYDSQVGVGSIIIKTFFIHLTRFNIQSLIYSVKIRTFVPDKTNKVMGLYKDNKSAKVGTQIECPVCHKKFVKKYYQQAFCCTEHKEKFWNNTRKSNGYFKRYNLEHPERLERIGINTDMYCDDCLGDPECESLAQITLDKSCYDFD